MQTTIPDPREILKITAQYKGYKVEVLNVTRDGGLCLVQTTNGAEIFGFSGMWGGCEKSCGWVPRCALTDITLVGKDTENVLEIEPNQIVKETAAWERQSLLEPEEVQ